MILTIVSEAQETMVVEPALMVLKEYDKVRDFTINQKGDEAYFSVQSQLDGISVICYSKKVDGTWSKPKIAPFSGRHNDLEPFLTEDGSKLYFVSNRSISDSVAEPKDFDIWFVERENNMSDWGPAKNMGAPINTKGNEFYPTLASNGNLYFTFDGEGSKGKDDIFFSELKNGNYTAPISLPAQINTEGYEYNAYISKDESYLLFGGYNRGDGYGNGDIYISFKDVNGEWSQAGPLPPEINTKYMDYCPFVDEENNVLYFTSIRANRVEKGFQDISELNEYLNGYRNGNSRLYKVDFHPEKLKKAAN